MAVRLISFFITFELAEPKIYLMENVNILSLPREAMFALFKYCDTIRFTCKRFYYWYDQWIVVDESRMYEYVENMSSSVYDWWRPEDKISHQLRTYSLIKLTGRKWDWNRTLANRRCIYMVSILLVVSDQLRANNLNYFSPDSSQYVLRYFIANLRYRIYESSAMVSYYILSAYPGIDFSAGVDRLYEIVSGKMEILRCTDANIYAYGRVKKIGVCGIT